MESPEPNPITYSEPVFSVDERRLIAEYLAPPLSNIFGYYALLYTPLARKLCTENLRIKNQLVVAPAGRGVCLRCRFEELPLAADSIDLALLPDIMQCSSEPHQLLREVERVLIPEGLVILIGRNPFCWRSIYHKLNCLKKKKPPHFNPIAKSRIIDWFQLLGLETVHQVSIGKTNHQLQQAGVDSWVKKVSQFLCDYFCSYYIIIARKKVSTLTPIKPRWQKNGQLMPPRVAEPTAKTPLTDYFKIANTRKNL